MPDDIALTLTDDQIVGIARRLRWQVQYDEIRDNAVELARAVIRAELDTRGRHEAVGLALLADIRAAVGDAEGRLMQPELLEHVRQLADRAAREWNLPAREAGFCCPASRRSTRRSDG